ncbi:phage tail protein [Streptomyces actuosus]|uniref:Phage tail protein n=1 Tax=Streptomyces actuosus TaxID=1885 RepID=A0ABS2VX72_STRAS|nr:phage tail protein [Streptomyces actuosus]MBN0047616.1 phage tail protein [Streptomyces actuosus]
MSRAAVPGLESRHPIGGLLPALYADDDFAQRFTAGLDTVLAPVFSTLDNLPAYLDPRVAPLDFVAWLSSWVGAADDQHRPAELRRAAVMQAVDLHRRRGTRHGLVERLRLTLGVNAEVTGDGGAAWSRTAGAALPPRAAGEVVVRVWPDRTPDVDEARVRKAVRVLCPVHVSCRVEFLPGPPAGDGE